MWSQENLSSKVFPKMGFAISASFNRYFEAPKSSVPRAGERVHTDPVFAQSDLKFRWGNPWPLFCHNKGLWSSAGRIHEEILARCVADLQSPLKILGQNPGSVHSIVVSV